MSTGMVYKRGNVWWIQYSFKGRAYRESAKTTRKADAEALLRKRTQAIWEGTFFPETNRSKSQKTIGELRDLFLKEKAAKRSLYSDTRRFGIIIEHLGEHTPLVTITDETVNGLLDWLAAERDVKTEATKNRYKALLRTAFNLATKKGIAHRDPMRAIDFAREDNARNRICSPEERDQLYAKCDELGDIEMRVFIAIGYWLGLREGEIAKLDESRVSRKTREFRLTAADTKEKERKTVPIPSAVFDEIEKLPIRLDGRLFGFSAQRYCTAFKELVDELGIKDLRFHDLRHTALTNMGAAGMTAKEMATISGHKTFSMLQRYVHTTPATMKSAMTRYEAYAAGNAAS
jgi:integrase